MLKITIETDADAEMKTLDVLSGISGVIADSDPAGLLRLSEFHGERLPDGATKITALFEELRK